MSMLREFMFSSKENEKTLLKVNSKTITIQVIYQNKILNKLNFSTLDIELIEFEAHHNKQGKANNLIIWEGVNPYKVAVSKFFTNTELEWLTTQLGYLLGIK